MGKLAGVIQFSGKLANAVGMRGQNGRNYIRIRRTEIKNPKSNAQCIQRMILATVAKSIAFLSVVLASAVEGKANGGQTLAYLRGQWMRMLRTSDMLTANSQYEYLIKNADTFAANPYLLSKGSIVAPKYSIEGSDVNIEGMDELSDGCTASEVFRTIAVGNQITIIAVYVLNGDNARRVKYCRFAFKDDTTPALVNLELNPEAIDLVKAEGDWQMLSFTPDYLKLEDFIEGGNLVAFGLIVSNIENKQRSTSYLTVADGIEKQWSGAEAYVTYGDLGVQIDTVNSEYLNNSAVLQDTVEGVVSLQNAPVMIAHSGRTVFNVVGCPSQPTDVRLTFHKNDGTDTESGNLVGLTTADNIITGIGIYAAPSFSDGTWSITGDNTTQNDYSAISGYAICDGVKYEF